VGFDLLRAADAFDPPTAEHTIGGFVIKQHYRLPRRYRPLRLIEGHLEPPQAP
jgi:hypothetical protein